MRSQELRNRYFVYACLWLTVAISLFAIAGVVGDIGVLRSFIPGYPEMRPVTAMTFALIATALLVAIRWHRDRWTRIVTTLFGIGLALISAYALVAYFLGGSPLEGTFLLPDLHGGEGGNRMSPHGAFCFLLIGISLATVFDRERSGRISVITSLTTLAAGYAALLGQLYGAHEFYGTVTADGMAIPTAFLFVVVSLALVVTSPHCRMLSILRGEGLGGQAARRLVPAVIVLPTLIGWLRVLGQKQNFYGTEFGATLAIFAMVVLMMTIVVYYTYTVHTADERRRIAETDLVENEKRYHDLFDYSQGMICIHDLDGKLLSVNPAASRALGYDAETIVGRNLAGFLPESERAGFPVFLRQIENEGLSNGLLPIVAKNGKQLVWRYTSILVQDPGKEPYVIGHAQDVTELIEAQRELEGLTLTDDLTGLLNRRGFMTLAEQQLRLEKHKGTARGLTLMFADMDGLKAINDRYGHDAGSDAIITFGRLLRSALRDADMISRWGGDEFVILTIGAQNEDADLLVSRIRSRLWEHNSKNDKPYSIECSIGVAPISPEDGSSFEDVIARADRAMYVDKKWRKAHLISDSAISIVSPVPQPEHRA